MAYLRREEALGDSRLDRLIVPVEYSSEPEIKIKLGKEGGKKRRRVNRGGGIEKRGKGEKRREIEED